MTKCLRCGAGAEWLEGKVPDEPKTCRRCDILTQDNARLRKQFVEACELLRYGIGAQSKSGWPKEAASFLARAALKEDT